MKLEKYIASVKDFPIKGIDFKDITPLMQDKEAFKYTIDKFAEYAKDKNVTVIVGPEARGFIFGCPLAYSLNVGFVPVRKPGKLPRETIEIEYDLEYGSNTLSMHKDSIKPGDRVLICDDLLATGGTVSATIKLIEKMGGIVVGACFLIELTELDSKKYLSGVDYISLLKY